MLIAWNIMVDQKVIYIYIVVRASCVYVWVVCVYAYACGLCVYGWVACGCQIHNLLFQVFPTC